MTTLTCKTCKHFKDGPAHPNYADLCSKIGTREYANAPDTCYSPAPIQIVRAEVNVEEVGKLLRHLDADQMHVLGELIKQSTDLQEVKLKFGQPVFINLGSTDVLSNYYKGFVVGMTVVKTSDGPVKHVYVSSNLSFNGSDKAEHRTLLCLMPDSLMTSPLFKKRKLSLIAENRLDEGVTRHKEAPLPVWLQNGQPMPTNTQLDFYEPPTIDTAPSAWLELFKVEEIEALKSDVKVKRQKNIIIDQEAQEKRKERASKRLQTSELHNEDGTVTKVVTFAQEPNHVSYITLPARKRG